MGHRKNKSGSGRRNGKEVFVTFVEENDDDDFTFGDEEEAKIFGKLLARTDILLEIFSRLPPVTLFRFSTISKGLSSFIGQAEFAALHSRNCRLVAGRSITGIFSSGGGKIQFINTIGWEAGELPDPSLEFLKQKSRCDEIKIMDSCNGLLLCSSTTYGRNGYKYFVCNPLTREKVALPHIRKLPPKSRSRKDDEEEEVHYSSKYALMADLDHHHLKYKVVRISYSWPRSTSPDDRYTELAIWFSEIGQWVELGQKLPPFTRKGYSPRVLFNGSLYWDCLEGHILVCPLNLKPGEPCYYLIDAPAAPEGRCLWKSEDKLHCYCQGFDDEFPDWILSTNGEHEPKWELLLHDSETFRNLTHDVIDQVVAVYSDQWNPKCVGFNIISYAPQPKAFFLSIGRTVYIYYVDERWLEYFDGYNPLEDTTTFPSHGSCTVFPYVHSMVHIQTPKTARNRLGASIAMPIQNRRVDYEAEIGFETKKVRGRHNKRTPKCQDYSLEEIIA